jgi:hypothetical protein
LWKSIVGDLPAGWALDERELHLLAQACRCADELALLEAVVDRDGAVVGGSRGQTAVHPALAEARQLRIVQLRLLGALELADPKSSLRSSQARHAAQARWARRPMDTSERGVRHG